MFDFKLLLVFHRPQQSAKYIKIFGDKMFSLIVGDAIRVLRLKFQLDRHLSLLVLLICEK